VRRDHRRQLPQRERVAAGVGDELIPERGRQRHSAVVEHRGGAVRVQARQVHLRDAGRGEGSRVVARGEEDHDALPVQPARGEQQRVGRRAVEPLRVVHEAEHRCLLGRLGEQRQHSGTDHEPVAAAGAEPEGPGQRPPLRPRQRVEAIEGGAEEQVQAGERQLGLGLDPGATHDPHAVGPLRGLVEKCGLADARLASNDQRTADAIARRVEQFLDHGLLSTPSMEHAATLPKQRADAAGCRSPTTDGRTDALRRRPP
jgi:hypothetical protein